MHSNYNKVSETSMPVSEVEAWLNEFEHKRAENKPNGGIIRSTATVVFTDGAKYKMSKKERKAAIAQAQKEHKAAMRELAIQERKDQAEIARKRKLWAKEIKAIRKKPSGKNMRQIVAERQDALEARLRSGEYVKLPEHEGATKNEYNTMRRDALAIRNRFDGGIVRLKRLNGEQSYYANDTLETFDGDINYSDIGSVKAALETKKAVRLNSGMYQQERKNLASIVRQIDGVTGIYGLDKSIKGWVML